jgi:hypothetical protein
MKTTSYVCIEVDHIMGQPLKTLGAHPTLEAAKQEAVKSAKGWCEDEEPTLFPASAFRGDSLPGIPNATPLYLATGYADFGCAIYETVTGD